MKFVEEIRKIVDCDIFHLPNSDESCILAVENMVDSILTTGPEDFEIPPEQDRIRVAGGIIIFGWGNRRRSVLR